MQASATHGTAHPRLFSMLKLWDLLVVAGVLAGCSVYSVSNSPNGGIPFYTWDTACRQQTVWVLPAYKVTLKEDYLDEKGKVLRSEQKGPIFVNQELIKSPFYKDVMSYNPNGGKISPEEIINSFGELASNPKFTSPGMAIGSQYPDRNLLVLVSNSVVPQTYINYKNPSYFNARRPWIGTVDATVKLSDKGTLSEGTAKIDDQTIKTFLDFIPTTVQAAATAIKILSPKEMYNLENDLGESPEEAAKTRILVTATIEPQYYQYTVSNSKAETQPESSKNNSLCEDTTLANPLPPGENRNVSRVLLTSGDKEKTADEDKSQKIGISGTVTLPAAAPGINK